MKNLYKIFGIGLPRTGSTSLAEALRVLGLKGSNFCTLNNIYTQDESTSAATFNIDNSFYKIYKKLFEENPGSKFILTTRDNSSWRKSMSGFDHDRGKLPNINIYNREVIAFFSDQKASDRLLIIDLTTLGDEEKWISICSFLGESKIPKISFPHISMKLK